MLAHLRELVRFKDLIRNLVARNLKVRYKNSVLGILWSLLNPLFMMSVYTVVFVFMRAGNGSVRNQDFPVFVLCALLPWNFFSGAVIESVGSIVDNASLVKKVYFPREILPLSVVLSNLVNFGIALTILIPMLLIFGIGFTPWILMLPVVMLIQFCFITGMALILSTLNVFYRDTRAIMDVAMMAWFFVNLLQVGLHSYGFFGSQRHVWYIAGALFLQTAYAALAGIVGKIRQQSPGRVAEADVPYPGEIPAG